MLDYINPSTGAYIGFDRFGRAFEPAWWQHDGDGNVTGKLDENDYAYDRAGNVTNHLEGGGGMAGIAENYGYDSLDRLNGWVEQSPPNFQTVRQTRSWTYDALGNDLDSGGYNLANEETPDSGGSQYDAAGNMVVLQSTDKAKYDAWNRLVEVDDSSGNPLEKYTYDGTGRRIQIFSSYSGGVAGTVDDNYYSGQQVIETRENSAVKYQYLWSPRYIDAPILRDTYSGGSIVLAERIFYLGDANYNVTAVVKQVNIGGGQTQWQVTERYSYDPYGVVSVWQPNWTDPGTVSQPGIDNTLLYAGREYDYLTSLYYNRARFYDPGLQRFINRDPSGYDGGINLYEYCGDAPLDHTDPLGLGDACSIQLYLGDVPDNPNGLNGQANWQRFVRYYLRQPHTWIGIQGSYARGRQCLIPSQQRIPGWKTWTVPDPSQHHIVGEQIFSGGWVRKMLQAAVDLAHKLCDQGCDTVTVTVACDQHAQQVETGWEKKHTGYVPICGQSYTFDCDKGEWDKPPMKGQWENPLR